MAELSGDGFAYGDVCVNWGAYDLPSLAHILDEDHAQAWQQVSAWQHTYEMVSHHRQSLLTVRDRLAQAWPPAKSMAAQAFLEYLDTLTASMRDTEAAALANQESLSGVLVALSEARQHVDQLQEQWHQYAQQDNASINLLGLRVGGAADGWQQRITRAAQDRMASMERTVFEYAQQMTVPATYISGTNLQTGELFVGPVPTPTGPGRVDASALRPPMIAPPLVPLGLPPTSVVGPASANGDPPAPPSAPVPVAESPPPTRPSQARGPNPGERLPGWESLIAGGLLPRGGVIGQRSGPAPTIGDPPSRARPDGGPATPVSRSPGSTLPPANPAGGLLGQPSSGTPGQRGQGPTRRRDLDPDQRWLVGEGVAPVLLPDPLPTEHQPGPGVIGIDR